MQFKTIARLLGLLLMIFSISMLTPLVVQWIYRDGEITPFTVAFLVTLSAGFLIWYPFRGELQELKVRDGFLIVVLFWFVLCFFAALPLMLAVEPHDSFTDAMFESVSGFTTTGASVLKNLDKLPHDLRFYRQQLQFLGGMGIVVLAVAILPMLGIGGMQLYRAETPGPLKDAKLTPRITQTAKALWILYVALTLICALCFYAAGMSAFDALGESFATISTGGFSMHDSSFQYYNSNTIEIIGILFMFLGGTNFSLHYLALRNRSLSAYWHDEEFRCYSFFLLSTGILITSYLLAIHYYSDTPTAFIKSLFNVVSIATTSGFNSAPFQQWPTFIPILLMLLAIVGGSAASTSGGIKVIRSLLIFKQSRREIKKLLHPQAVLTIKFGKRTLPDHVLQAMWGFLSAFIGLFILLILGLMACGNDLTTSFGAVVASLANAGAGIGSVANGFENLSIMSKWLLIFAMLAGRLEIFSLLVLFSPAFWQR